MPIYSHRATPFNGRFRVPGDKSMSHRALILASLAQGRSQISGLLAGEDVLRTAAALRVMGISIERQGEWWSVTGAPWKAPRHTLYCGNAGTGARLLMGAVAGQHLAARFDGDASLRARPMGRILAPLRAMGVTSHDRQGKLPVQIDAAEVGGMCYCLPTPSAQVKSALLLAGLGLKAGDQLIIEEPVRCRDHTERMLCAFGVELKTTPLEGGGLRHILPGGQHLQPQSLSIPGDPSSAAFPLVAALIVPGSELVLENVMMNETRIGIITTLIEMGAHIEIGHQRESGGETVADLKVYASALHGVEVPCERAPSMIDEYPILCMAAAYATGVTRMNGLGELRVKESDRLAALEQGLRAAGVAVTTGPDWIEITGNNVAGNAIISTHMDHRIAMSFLVLGMGSKAPIAIDSAEMINTSFPAFIEFMNEAGGKIG